MAMRGTAGRRIVRSNGFMRDAMERWGPAVWGLALARTCSAADAQDVYQDVFIRLAMDDTDFAEEEHLKAWLLRVALNRCRDLERSAWRRRTVALDEVAEAADPAADPSLSVEARELVDAVAGLAPKLREAVYLHYALELGCDEIARLVGVRPATVRTRLHRARNQLRLTMGGRFDGEGERDEGEHGEGERGEDGRDPIRVGMQAR